MGREEPQRGRQCTGERESGQVGSEEPERGQGRGGHSFCQRKLLGLQDPLTCNFIRPGLEQFLRQVMSKVRVLRWSFLK